MSDRVMSGAQRFPVAAVLLALGLAALPFSTGADAGVGVISFGLPILALVGLAYVATTLVRPEVPRDAVVAMVAGASLVAAVVIGLVNAPERVATAARVIPQALGFILFAYVLSPQFDRGDGRAHERLTAMIIVCGGIIATYFVLRFAIAVQRNGLAAVAVDRVTGGVFSLPWGATNVVASSMILPLFLTFFQSRPSAPPAWRAVAVVARILMFAAIGAALSRGANSAVALGLVLSFFVLPSRGRRRLAMFLVLVAVAIVIADWRTGGMLREQATSSFFSRFSNADVSDLNGRTEIWNRFAGAFLSHPLFGIGYYGSEYLLGSSGHDFVLTALAERGLIGTGLSALVLIVAVFYAVRGLLGARRPDDRLFFGTLVVGGIAAMGHLMVEDANYTQQYMILSWLELALPLLAWRRVAAEAEAQAGALGTGPIVVSEQ